MVRQNHLRAVGDEELPVHRQTLLLQHLDLSEKGRRIKHYTVADHTFATLAQNAAWNQVQYELLARDDDRVSGIMTTGVPRHYGEALRQNVDNLSLTLIAPLGTQNDR